MDTLRVMFRVRILDGKLEAFQRHALALLAMVETHCPGTVEYEWFLDAARAECVVLETFANSAAFLRHVDLVAARAAQMFALCELQDIWLCGNPSPEVLTRSAAFAPGALAQPRCAVAVPGAGLAGHGEELARVALAHQVLDDEIRHGGVPG